MKKNILILLAFIFYIVISVFAVLFIIENEVKKFKRYNLDQNENLYLETGSYMMFVEFKSLINGNHISSSNVLPKKFKILVKGAQNENVIVKPFLGKASYNLFNFSGNCIAKLEISKGGDYMFDLEFEKVTNKTDNLILAVGKGFKEKLVFTTLLFLILGSPFIIWMYRIIFKNQTKFFGSNNLFRKGNS